MSLDQVPLNIGRSGICEMGEEGPSTAQQRTHCNGGLMIIDSGHAYQLVLVLARPFNVICEDLSGFAGIICLAGILKPS